MILRPTGSFFLGQNFIVSILTEILAYKKRGDSSHKEMQSLIGVHVKDEAEKLESNLTLYPFMLIFPNKSRIYYLKSEVSFLANSLGRKDKLATGDQKGNRIRRPF